MSFIETVRRARELLREEGRITARGLKREFDLSDDALEELIEELVEGQQVAAREGKAISWIGRADVEPETRPSESEAPREATHEAEHRQLTVMFCDLVDSTELSQRLDAEDLAEVLSAYQKMCVTSIESFEGHVAQYLGDGLLVYFGYPMAHEDDAMRAVHAALRIVHESPRLNKRLADAHPALRERPLRQRIGIHTGPTLVGEVGAGETREHLALGDTVNVAARLEGEAEPGSIVVSGATRQLVHGAFVFEALGERSLKGVEEKVAVFRPVQATGVRSRLALAGAEGLTPLAGREHEVGVLLERWEEAKAGRGQVVLLSGEAGMGKSRLIEVLRKHVADERVTWHEYRGSVYHKDSAFHPIIEMIERTVMFTETDPPAERLAKLAQGLEYSGFPADEILPLIAHLMGLPQPGDLPPLALSPEARRRRTLETLAVWPVALARRQPVIMIGEDLHWFDPSSLELAGMLTEHVPAAPILFVATFRSGFELPWSSHSRWMHLPLQPLTDKHVEAMARHFAGGKPLPREVRQQILDRTDGVPLFVEEFTKAVLESGLVAESDQAYERTDPLPSQMIPSTLRDSLTARLDRLGPSKELAQLAAVLGREFSHELIEAVSSLEPGALEAALGKLVGAGLLYQRGIPPRATYVFKHALIQDAAYGSLVKRTRQRLHGRVLDALETESPERAAAAPELLAQHAVAAGRIERAITLYERAGEQARDRSGYEEAIRHLRQASALVAGQSDGREPESREAAFQLQIGNSAIAARGYSAPEVEVAFERARVLCEAVGDTERLGWALAGLVGFRIAAGQVEAAALLAAEVMALAERTKDTDLALRSSFDLAHAEFYQGKFSSSLAHCEAALASYEAGRCQLILPAFAIIDRDSPKLSLCAWNLGALGWMDRALERACEAVGLARRISHPYSLVTALVWETMIHWSRGDVQGQLESAAEVVSLSDAQAFPFWAGVARTLHAGARVGGGERAASADLLSGLTQSGGSGRRSAAPAVLALVGEAYLAAGQPSEARDSVEAGLALAGQGLPFWEAELHRLKGETFRAQDVPSPDAAEAEFHCALGISRTQEARTFELRAATSLARLWQGQSKRSEAHGLLEPLYEWFTEGFDTRDLKDAKALLQELA